MAIQQYTVKSSDVIHETSADFVKRIVNMPIHLMQYDNTLPIVAVELLENGEPFILPESNNIDMYIRWGLKDHNFVEKPILGCNAERNTIYFAVDETMVSYDGSLNTVLEYKVTENFIDSSGVLYTSRTACSSYIRIEIDRNPIQKSDLQVIPKYDYFVKRVTANPEIVEGSPYLNSLGIDNINYTLPVGTPVIPNATIPEGSPYLKTARIANLNFKVGIPVIPNTTISEDSPYLKTLSIDDLNFKLGYFSAEKKEGETITPISGIVFEEI